jgi:hypothetical protein
MTNARSINERHIDPPHYIQQAADSMLAKRSKITTWYRNLPDPSLDTIRSTESHEYMNGILLQVYRLPFPHAISQQKRDDTAKEKGKVSLISPSSISSGKSDLNMKSLTPSSWGIRQATRKASQLKTILWTCSR